MSTESQELETKEVQGAFIGSLKRSNAKIKADRAEVIYEDAELVYRRKIEDIENSIKRLKRDQENMLDLSPVHADSLMLGKDFDADAYVADDVEIGIKIRNSEIKLEVATRRYEYLFGPRKK